MSQIVPTIETMRTATATATAQVTPMIPTTYYVRTYVHVQYAVPHRWSWVGSTLSEGHPWWSGQLAVGLLLICVQY